jgi:hypothetical protein
MEWISIKNIPDNDLARRMKIVKYYNIDTIFDIERIRQYAFQMRGVGYKKRIISFEPLKVLKF